MKNMIFAEKTFVECLLFWHQRTSRPKQRKLSRIATKPRNLWKFSPLKVSCYMVTSLLSSTAHSETELQVWYGVYVKVLPWLYKDKNQQNITLFTHWFSHSDDSEEFHHIGMSKLPIDSCLLQKLDSVFLWGTRLQCLHSHFHGTSWRLPYPHFHCPKLTRTKMLCYPERKKTKTKEKPIIL